MTERINALVLGSGGREHALVWKLSASELCGNVYCIPGNGGISETAETAEEPAGFPDLLNFINEKEISIVFVGPEAPLAAGVSDFLLKSGIRVFGPVRAAARLEESKIFAKKFMKEEGIPTAHFEVFSTSADALSYVSTADPDKIVIKADGLCGGKGVILPESREEAIGAVEDLMERKTRGGAGGEIVIEERLEGEEASVLVMLNGDKYVFLMPSRDHKQVFDGGRGPNTGGMGAYAPTPSVTGDVMKKVESRILLPLIAGLSRRGITYSGVLYIGLMISGGDPGVIEFNVRLGDPETQAVLPMLESDLLNSSIDLLNGKKPELRWRSGCCVSVVLASGGYPGEYRTGFPIEIDRGAMPEGVTLFHAGTRKSGGKFYTAGGRVLSVSALGKDLDEARGRAYAAAGCISFEGMYFRKDIGLAIS